MTSFTHDFPIIIDIVENNNIFILVLEGIPYENRLIIGSELIGYNTISR